MSETRATADELQKAADAALEEGRLYQEAAEAKFRYSGRMAAAAQLAREREQAEEKTA